MTGFLLFQMEQVHVMCIVVLIELNCLIFHLHIIPYTLSRNLLGVSENGQYFWAASENGIEVFEVIGTTTQLIYTDTRFYKGALSVPSHPDQIICRVGQAIEHRHLPDFSLIQSMDVTTYGLCFGNVDPVR